ncbi:hypothetical protein BDW22DRAFT_254106 [Trametopsis cervina]|nr:hypothetical protein BDW22DRAFT_254106 [Trametopsis cervina]
MSSADEVAAAADIWKNWRTFTIKGKKSTRSSCPHYKGQPPHGAGGDDSDQLMDKAAIDALRVKKVKYLISANHNSISDVQKAALTKAGIGYQWLPVPDFQAPSITQFKDCHREYRKNKEGVHFYCGWGDGRSGTYVTGVEILEGVYTRKPTVAQYKKNHVERDVQFKALDALWEDWHKTRRLDSESGEVEGDEVVEEEEAVEEEGEEEEPVAAE